MKERFEAHRARMTPEERERTWSAISGKKRRGIGTWRIPTVAVSALATVAVVVLMVRTDTMPDLSSVVEEQERARRSAEAPTLEDAAGLGAASADRGDRDERAQAGAPAPSLENDVVEMEAPTGKSERGGDTRKRQGTDDEAFNQLRESATRAEPEEPKVALAPGTVESLPVDELESAVALKAEEVVAAGESSIRGGRPGEVSEVVDGVPGEGSGKPAPPADHVPTESRSWTDIRSQAMSAAPTRSEPGQAPAQGPGERSVVFEELDKSMAEPRRPLPPPDAMTHAHPGVNPFVDTATDALATFALDVDHASYTLARAYLRRGTLPPPAAIRVEEFVNAMPHDYAPPSGGPVATTTLSSRDSEDAIGDGTFAIHLDASESPFGEGKTLLRVGLKGREITRVERKPAILTFVVDTSGSMSRENRIGLVRDALVELLYQLDSRDRVAIVAYGSTARTVLPMTTIRERRAIENAIRALTPDGSTNAEAGLRMAYEIADEHYEADAINRVILCSDGVANVGETDPDGIMATIKRNTGRGITMTAIGVGMGNYNDALLERIANTGDGSYYYVDSAAEAEKVFVAGSVGTLEIIARDAKVQVELDPKTVRRYRLLGYENRDVADRDFRNDTVDAGEIGAGHEVTALFELELADDVKARDRVATVRVRFESPEMGAITEDARTLRAGAIRRGFDRMAPDFRLDAAVAELAEILRKSPHADGSSLDAVLNVAEGVQEDRPDAAHVAEVIELASRARDLVTDGNPPTWRER